MQQYQEIMKRQVISQYNQSKQVLNDFFNNSDDEDEDEEQEEERHKEAERIHDDDFNEEIEQYEKQDALSPLPFQGRDPHNQNALNQNAFNQFDISLQNIQQIQKIQIASHNNIDHLLGSCNNSLILQQNLEDHSQAPSIQNHHHHHNKLILDSQKNITKFSSTKKVDPILQNMSLNDEDINGGEYERKNNLENGNLYYNNKIGNQEENIGQKKSNIYSAQIAKFPQYQQKQGGSKYQSSPNELGMKEEIVKLTTSHKYGNDSIKNQDVKNMNIPISQDILNKQKKIKLMQIEDIESNNIILHESHRQIIKQEISFNFLGFIFFGIFLLIKKIFLNDLAGTQSHAIPYLLACVLIIIGLLGLFGIFFGLMNQRLLGYTRNPTNSKIINSYIPEKGGQKDIQSRFLKNKKQIKPKTMKINPQLQQSPLPLRIKQKIKQKQFEQNQNKQSNIYQITRTEEINCKQFWYEKWIISIIIMMFIISFIIFIESIRLLEDIQSIITIFFIYHQFIILYKLSASRYSIKVTQFVAIVLLSYALIRSKLYFYLNDFNQTDHTLRTPKFTLENIVMEAIFCLLLFAQLLPLRFFSISTFFFNTSQNSFSEQEKILLRAGISSNVNIDEWVDYNEENDGDEDDFINKTTSKQLELKRKMDINRIKSKNLQFLKQTKRDSNSPEDLLLNNENSTPLSPDIVEKQKRNHIKKMYQDILNVIPEGVALINSQNKLVYANKTLSKILQCQKNQIVNILLNLATKSKAEYDTTSQRGVYANTHGVNSPQYSKVHSLNQQIPQRRITSSQSQFKSFNSLYNNNNNNNTNSINNLNFTNGQNDINKYINSCGIINGQIGILNENNNQQNLPYRKTSAEMFDMKRKTSATNKPSIFNRNHKNSLMKDENPTPFNLNSIGNNNNNNGTQNNLNYNQMLTQSNTKNLSTNGATPNNLNLNTYQTIQGSSDIRKWSVPGLNQSKQSPFEQSATTSLRNHPIEDLADKNGLQQNINSGRQTNLYSNQTPNHNKQTYDYSDALSLTNYIALCPQGMCQSNCIHLQKDNADASSLNDQLRSGFLNHLVLNASPQPNQQGSEVGENLVRQQRSKKFKNSKIIRKDISVRDILSSIFENLKQTQQDQDSKTEKTFQLKKRNSDITSHNTHKTRKNSPSRQGSFISQMKNQQYIGYFQYVDDMIKVEVEYKNSTLVLSMVMCEIVTNGYVEQLALVLIDPLWQEMYEKKLEDMSNYRMKMFASLSHELRTPLNCSISMLQQLKNIMKEDFNSDQQPKQETLTIKERIRNKLLYTNQNSIMTSSNSKLIKSEDQISNSKQFEKIQEYISSYIDPALNSNNLLLNLVNDILDFVQIDSGKFKFTFIKFDLEQLLSNCISLVGIQGKQNEKSVELILKYDEKCPKIINSDPNRIRQVVLNFLSNALKFTSQGQIVLQATLINYKDKQTQSQNQNLQKSQFAISEEIMNNTNNIVEISVEDQGIGISPEDIEKIFTIFNKIDLGENQALNSQGCGLGLTISNSISKGLGPFGWGGIRVQSQIGEGSAFSILVEDREEDLQEHKINNKEEAIRKMETINSLVDSPISQQTKMRQLSSFGQIENQYVKQSSVNLYGRNHSIKPEESPQVRTLRINSNFTNKTNKTNKTNRTNKTAKTNNQKNIGGSVMGGSNEESCYICDSEINRNTVQHFTPLTPFQIKEQELAEFDDLTSSLSSNHSDFINRDILNMSQKSRNTYRDNQKPLYKSATIHSKTTYKTKTLKTIKSEQKDVGDGYISYNSIHSQINIKKRGSNSPSAQLIKTPTSSQESAVQIHLSPIDGNAKQPTPNKRKLFSSIKNSQSSSSTSLPQQQKKGLTTTSSSTMLKQNVTSSSALKNIATTATTVMMPPSQQDNFIENTERQSQEISINQDLNYMTNFKKSELEEQFDAQNQVFDNSGDFNQKNVHSLNQLIQKNSSNINNTSIETKNHIKKQGKACDCAQVLVVDDNQFNMHAITMQLKTYGFKIDSAQNGQEAVNQIEKRYYENSCCKTYKIIFMDIEMPIKNGYEATQDIRNFFNNNSYISKQPIIVACTAYVSDEDKDKALKNGMDDFIKKPVFQEGLDLLLNQWYNIIFDENDDFDQDSQEDFPNDLSN